jgi:uncharacterized membrane protein YccC
MTPKPTDVGRKHGGRLGRLLGVLLLCAAVAVFLALFVTHGWADIFMVFLALAALLAAYAVRREARRRLLYEHGNGKMAQRG